MQIAVTSRIDMLRAQARRQAQAPLPLRLWQAAAASWQEATQRRVEYVAQSLDHAGVAADVEAARRWR